MPKASLNVLNRKFARFIVTKRLENIPVENERLSPDQEI